MPTPTPRIVALCRTLPVLCALVVSLFFVAIASAAESTKSYSINSGPAATTLKEFAEQSGRSVLFSTEKVQGISTNAIRGDLTAEEALDRLLSGTRLSAVPEKSTGGFAIRREVSIEAAEKNVSSRPANSRAADDVQDGVVKLDTFEVFGRKTLNMDIKRTRDDVQPYVIYSNSELQQSGALNLEEFLRSRLTMNAVTPSDNSSLALGTVGTGQINLRGLNVNQTLILVDGRRLPGVSSGTQFGQPNINGISPSSVDRIEVLPTTASGIYGGGATGGVINIILKRNYTGINIEGAYGSASDKRAERKQVSINGGYSHKNGKTKINFGASFASQSDLLSTEREFASLAFRRLITNYPTIPAATLSAFAFGSSTNIISATSAPLTFDPEYGGAPLNSAYTYVPSGFGGVSTVGVAGLQANAGHLQVTGRPNVLLGSPTQKSMSIGVRQELNNKLQLYVDANLEQFSNRLRIPQFVSLSLLAGAATNPFQQNILVNMPLYENGLYTTSRSSIETLRTNVGLVVELPRRWSAALDFGLARNRLPYDSVTNRGATSAGLAILHAAALTDLPSSPIPNIESLFSFTHQVGLVKSVLEDLSLRGGGPIYKNSTGDITLSVLLEHRREYNDDAVTESKISGLAPTYGYIPRGNQTVSSGYIELRAPLISQQNQMPFANEIEFTAALREDRYNTTWATNSVPVPSPKPPYPVVSYSTANLRSLDYTFGLKYSPQPGIAFRASYGTGFLPPALFQIKPNDPQVGTPGSLRLSTTIDPRRNGEALLGDPGNGLVTQITGGNNALKAEASRSISFGAIISPSGLDGLRISLDYLEIKKSQEISNQGAQFFLNNESDFSGRVGRAALTSADIAAGLTSGRVNYLDLTYINLFRTSVRSLDIRVDYAKTFAGSGEWNVYLAGTEASQFRRQTSPTVTARDSVGYLNGPLKWRANVGLDWKRGPWQAGWNAQYYDAYSLLLSTDTPTTASTSIPILGQGTATIPSQVYHDLYVKFTLPPSKRFWSEMKLSVGVQNVFNKYPPIIAVSTLGYSTFADPRLRRITVGVQKSFGR